MSATNVACAGKRGNICAGNNVSATMCPRLPVPLVYIRRWQTRKRCGNIVAHDVSLRAQTGKYLLRTQNVSEQTQKHFLCPGHTNVVRAEKHLCRQQCVRNNVSSFARAYN